MVATAEIELASAVVARGMVEAAAVAATAEMERYFVAPVTVGNAREKLLAASSLPVGRSSCK